MGNQIKGEEKTDEITSIFSSGKEEQEEICPKLSFKQRIVGFLACSITGFVISWILTFVFVISGFDVTTYALIFSFCQILNIASSCFLCTPKGHLKSMKKKSRIIPSAVYCTMIILTIVIAVATGVKGLVLLCVIILTVSYYWYTISFIPYGNKILKKICGQCLE